MYYRVTLINDSEDTSAADIIWVQSEQTFFVSSNNVKLKRHLDLILGDGVFMLAPGENTKGYSSDGVTYIPRDSVYYFMAIPDILAWRGYKTELHEEVHKSMIDTMKAADMRGGSLDDYVTLNDKGERIVSRVPHGYTAVNTETGAYRIGGQWLNANIDKEDAVWVIEENPYEAQSQDQEELDRVAKDRAARRLMYKVGEARWSPGLDEEAYAPERFEEGADYSTQQMAPDKGGKYSYRTSFAHTKLSELFKGVKEKLKDALEDKVKELKGDEDPREAKINPAPVGEDGEPMSGVIFSKGLGLAFDTSIYDEAVAELKKAYPNFVNADWHIVPNPKGRPFTDEEKTLQNPTNSERANPVYIQGTTEGLVRVIVPDEYEEDWYTLPIDLVEKGDVVSLNPRDPVPPFPAVLDAQEQAKRDEISAGRGEALRNITVTSPITQRPTYSPEKAAAIHVEGLYTPGDKMPPSGMRIFASFKGREYQRYVLSQITDLKGYEIGGGPRGVHGAFLHGSYGIGKTLMSCAWYAIMSSKKNPRDDKKMLIDPGKQAMFVVAPKMNTDSFADEYKKFTKQSAMVITGDRQSRLEKWKQLIDMANRGEMPGAVILPASLYRMEVNSDDREYAIDAKMLQLMIRGGSYAGNKVEGKHVGGMVIDESGQYVNVGTNRREVFNEILDDLYMSNALTLTLTGDAMGNSATDTISQAAFIDAGVRQNQEGLRESLTVLMRPTIRPKRNAPRVWRDAFSPAKLVRRIGSAITTIDSKYVAGDKYGMVYTDPVVQPMGATWGELHDIAVSKLLNIFNKEATGRANDTVKARALAFVSILMNMSYGATSAPRLLDYDIGYDSLISGLVSPEYGYTAEEIKAVQAGIGDYLRRTTEMVHVVGGSPSEVRLPRMGMDTKTRDEIFIEELNKHSSTPHFGSRVMRDLNHVVGSWHVPALDYIKTSIESEFGGGVRPNGKNKKIGVAGFSRVAIEKLHDELKAKYGNNVLVQIINGDTTPKEARAIEKAHEAEKDRHVITLVTTAAKFGFSLPADVSYRTPMWNPASGEQMSGRFHRDPFQLHISTEVLSSGASEYMKSSSEEKAEARRTLISRMIGSQEFLKAVEDGKPIDIAEVLAELSKDNDSEEGLISPNAAMEEVDGLMDYLRTKKTDKLKREYSDFTPQEEEEFKLGQRQAKEKAYGPVKERDRIIAAAEKLEKQLAEQAKRAAKKKPVRQSPPQPTAAVAARETEPKTRAKKSVVVHKKLFDVPTLTRNPLYEEWRRRNGNS